MILQQMGCRRREGFRRKNFGVLHGHVGELAEQRIYGTLSMQNARKVKTRIKPKFCRAAIDQKGFSALREPNFSRDTRVGTFCWKIMKLL